MLFDFFQLDPILLFISFGIGFLGGLVKGIVGFAMPMILLSGLTVLMPAKQALAALILPTLITNIMQASNHSTSKMTPILREHGFFLLISGGFLILSSQLTPHIPTRLFLGVLGFFICFFSLFQLLATKINLKKWNFKLTFSIAAMTGFVGGMSGIWGPLTVVYLSALRLPKEEHIKVQGVIYSLGSLLLLLSHIKSGIFTLYSATFSVFLVIPALAGLFLGSKIRNGLDEKKFQKLTSIVLLFAGLNLVRKAYFT